MVADVSRHRGRLCGSKAGESRVVGDGDRSAAFSTTTSTSSTSSELSTTTSKLAALAATASSAAETSVTITPEAIATATTTTSSSDISTLTSTPTSSTSSTATTSTLRFLESIVDVNSLLGLAFAFTLGFGFLSFEESSLLFFLERLGLGPLLVLLLTLIWSASFLGTETQICQSLGFLLRKIVGVTFVVVLWLRICLVKTIAGHAVSWSCGVFESWILCRSIPVASTLGTGSPSACFFRLGNGFTSCLISEFSFAGIRSP